MSMLQRVVKRLTAMRHGIGQSMGLGLLKRTRFDYRKEIGDGLDASVVTAPIQWLQRAMPEATLAMKQRKADGDVVDLFDHDMLKLIANPNAFYGDIALWAGVIFSYCFDGNAYLMKVRNVGGKVIELWYVPHWMLEPQSPFDGSEFIHHYIYSPGNGIEPMRVEARDIVHFRHGINPNDIRKGISPIGGAIREIFMDLESSNFVASLLRNMGVPGVVISPKGGAPVSSDDAAATSAWFKEAYGGDNRGAPLVMGSPTDVQAYGFNPQQMNMSEARDIAEERVCACLGVPAAVVGFGAGLQNTQVGATMTELRKLAWHNGVLPIARSLIDELKRSLLPDFNPQPGTMLVLDTSDVLALQEDEDKRTDRKLKEYKEGAITLFDYRVETGRDADDSHKFYLRSIATIEVPEGQMKVVAQPEGTKALPAPDDETKAAKQPKASKAAYQRGTAYVKLLQRQERGLQTGFEASLKTLFVKFGKEAKSAAGTVLAKQPDLEQKEAKSDDLIAREILDRLGIDEWSTQLGAAYEAHYLKVAKAVAGAGKKAGLGASLPDPVARSIIAAGGRRSGIVDLDGQTKNAIFKALAEGRAEGEGATALASRIASNVDGGHWLEPETRARIIARTETKYAQNISTIENARAGGVERFIVFDGRLGPERSHADHIERDGDIVTAAKADAMAADEHPNGTLSFAPHFEELEE